MAGVPDPAQEAILPTQGLAKIGCRNSPVDPNGTNSNHLGTPGGGGADSVVSPPVYQRLAPRARLLHELGLSDSAIGRSLGTSDMTVRTATEWPAAPLKSSGAGRNRTDGIFATYRPH